MAERKIFAGHAVRRLRRQAGLSQAVMAERLEISASYLNLVERNQRPLTARVMMRLSEVFDFHPRALAAGEPGGGVDAIRRRLADPMFADLEVDRAEVEDWLAGAPGGAEAFARAYDRAGGDVAVHPSSDAGDMVAREIARWRGHFADLDTAAEALADELRLGAGDLFGAMAERLRIKHQLSIRILPLEVLPDVRVRLDLHARQIQLSETLDPASRSFALGRQIALIEGRGDIEALVRGASFGNSVAERLYRRHLGGYFAAALMMPYARFLRACETTGYDLELIRRRFGASAEQVAHRLTTLQRVGARGLPFFMLRFDRAGQVSKRFAGASGSPLVDGGLCPLLDAFAVFGRTDERIVQVVELEDGSRWFTSTRCVGPPGGWIGGVHARFAVTLGLPAEAAGGLAAARGLDLTGGAMPVGLGCRACTRLDCPQRSAAPAGRPLVVNEREAGLTPLNFAAD